MSDTLRDPRALEKVESLKGKTIENVMIAQEKDEVVLATIIFTDGTRLNLQSGSLYPIMNLVT